MADAFIYDPVRTPRGRGKPDGALHTATTLHLRHDGAQGDQGPQRPQGRPGRRRGDGLRRSGRRSGRRHRAHGRAGGGPRRQRARRADQPLLRFGPRLGQFRRGAGDVGPARADDRRRRRIDEPRRHRRLGRRLAGRSGDRHPRLFHAAGRLGRSHRHQIRLFARRRRRLRRPIAGPRRQGVVGRSVQAFDRAGARRQRPAAARARRAHAAGDQHAVARGAEAVVRDDGRAGRLRRGRDPGAPGSRAHQPRPPRRQFVGHRRRRRGGADRLEGGRRPARPQAARARARLRQYRLRAGDHADRPGRRDQEAARPRPHADLRHRSVRGQRGVRLGGAALSAGVRSRSRTRSTSTAAPSRSAIRSARPAR